MNGVQGAQPAAHGPFQPIDNFRIQRALANAGKIDNPFGRVVRHTFVTASLPAPPPLQPYVGRFAAA
jgi:hypothetical protein